MRLGTYQRWHSHCLSCQTCGKVAAMPAIKEPKQIEDKDAKDGQDPKPKLSTARRPPANVANFVETETVMRVEVGAARTLSTVH